MGTTSTVYGTIAVPLTPQALDAAERAISSLPETDEWPFLVKSMFSQTAGNRGLEYGSRIIHFGASYKELESEWATWVEKFERFLAQVPGTSAVVHLESEQIGDVKMEWANASGTLDSWQLVSGPRTL